MKTKILPIILSALSLAAATVPAHAGDRGDKAALAIGSFVGGVIVGSQIGRDHDHDRGRDRYRPSRTPPSCERGDGVTIVIERPRPRPQGYWEDVTEEVWVPSQVIVVHGERGQRTVRRVGGFFECRTRRVWVSTRGDRRDGCRD